MVITRIRFVICTDAQTLWSQLYRPASATTLQGVKQICKQSVYNSGGRCAAIQFWSMIDFKYSNPKAVTRGRTDRVYNILLLWPWTLNQLAKYQSQEAVQFKRNCGCCFHCRSFTVSAMILTFNVYICCDSSLWPWPHLGQVHLSYNEQRAAPLIGRSAVTWRWSYIIDWRTTDERSGSRSW